jgi:hypothetical protein
LAPDPEWKILNEPGFENAAKTVMQFPSGVGLDSALIALVGAEASNSSVGQLGLGNNSVLLKEMHSSGLSPSNGFAYLAGSQSYYSPRNGHLIIGGYDKLSTEKDFVTFPMNASWNGNRPCPLHVTVSELTLQGPGIQNGQNVPLITPGHSAPACIEPYAISSLLELETY